MYYKITNKECKVYKDLHELRTKEIQISKDNIAAIEERTGLKWDIYIGRSGQQNFRRTTEYEGFGFLDTEKVDLKIWRKLPSNHTIYIPNKRTKAGREMAEFITNGLKGSSYDQVFDILKLPCLRKFTFPFVEIVGDVIVIYLGDGHEPKDENLIEITKTEFNALFIGTK